MSASAVVADFFGSGLSKFLIAFVVAGAVGGLVVMISVVFGRGQARVERRLAGYEVLEAAKPAAPSDSLSAETRVVQQAVDITRGLAQRAGILERVEALLEQADLPVRPAELLFYVPAFALIVALIFAVIAGPLVGLVVFVVLLMLPVAFVNQRRRARMKAFEGQLPDTLALLAGSLRAGFSFIQGLEAVADECRDPMSSELQRAFTEARLGRSLEDALDDSASRMQSRDLAWAVMALKIQREVGGNLAELLDTIAQTMTERERLRREVRSLTAEGRFSAIILSLMPLAFTAMFFVLERSYIESLWKETVGLVAMVLAGVVNLVGWFWLRKIVEIEL